MTETQLPHSIQYLLLALQILALGIFLYFIWPQLKSEKWREKFIENKQAFSILIVFTLILVFVFGMGQFFDLFFPIERLDLPNNAPLTP